MYYGPLVEARSQVCTLPHVNGTKQGTKCAVPPRPGDEHTVVDDVPLDEMKHQLDYLLKLQKHKHSSAKCEMHRESCRE